MFGYRHLSSLAIVAIASSPVFAQDLVLRIDNRSSHAVTEFFASPSDLGDWEDDILGSDIIEAGESVEVIIADDRTQCEYDLLVVFEDGESAEHTADLCEENVFTVVD